jgi:heme-degrading monooxygenase HmoA
MTPLLVLAEFAFTKHGEPAFLAHLDRTLAEVRGIEGCLQAVVWSRPARRYQFSTLWSDADAVTRWVENEFHRTVLMPGFRAWCTEGCFGEYALATDHRRARKCESCGRWTQTFPGWDESQPSTCVKCGAGLRLPQE